MCKNCLYKDNCQFIATHKKSVVAGCTAFKSEADFKSEVASKIFEDIENILNDHFHADCQMGDCIEDYYDDDLRNDINEFKNKYI